MVQLSSTLGKAGPLCADILDQQVADGPDARVVTVTGKIDALTTPELAAFRGRAGLERVCQGPQNNDFSCERQQCLSICHRRALSRPTTF